MKRSLKRKRYLRHRKPKSKVKGENKSNVIDNYDELSKVKLTSAIFLIANCCCNFAKVPPLHI